MAVVSFSLKSADLSGLDELDTESIALFCWSDVRPLSGAAGFLDWRLCGALSRTLVNEQFVGDLNESMLMPTESLGNFNRFVNTRRPRNIRAVENFVGCQSKKVSVNIRHSR